MREIARVLCGSHLYGTAVEESDRDYKIIFIPSAQQILLGKDRTREAYDEEARQAVERLRKDACCDLEEADVEFFSLQHFLRLACQGQTIAMDILFTPKEYHIGRPEPEWISVCHHRDSFVSRNCRAFVHYCRQQVQKYVVKKERLLAINAAYDFFQNECAHRPFPGAKRVIDLEKLDQFVQGNPFTELVKLDTAQGGKLAHLSVCDLMVPGTASIKTAMEIYGRKQQEYGKRVARATRLHTEDWKSMYHAIRVAKEAMELMATGNLTFPRPERELLLAIRRGEIPYEDVSQIIEDNLELVEGAVEDSKLPEKPDWDLADRLVLTFYRGAVVDFQPYQK